VKNTKLFRHRKRSGHKLWKRKWVFLRVQKRGQLTLKKLFHALITIKPKSVEPEKVFQPWDYLSQNSETDWIMKVLWFSWVSIVNIIEKLCLINNSPINCAGTNSSNFTMLLSFIGFPGIFFSATRNASLNFLPRSGNTSFCYAVKVAAVKSKATWPEITCFNKNESNSGCLRPHGNPARYSNSSSPEYACDGKQNLFSETDNELWHFLQNIFKLFLGRHVLCCIWCGCFCWGKD